MKGQRNKKLLSERKGVVLIEVLFAVLILSVCLTMITRSLLGGVEILSASKDYIQGMMYADEKMFDLIENPSHGKNFVQEGSFDRQGKDYQYRARSDGFLTDGSLDNISEIQLSVSWPSGKNRREVSVATYLFNKK